MHIALGALIVIGSFLLAMDSIGAEFQGFWNRYSAILLLGVPIGLALISFRFGILWGAARGLWYAIARNPQRDRRRLAKLFVEFGGEVRGERGAQAARRLEAERDPVVRALGRHVLARTQPAEIEADALILGRRALEPYKQAERVLSALGDFAPAMGMIGTVIGLIELLANMRDFDKLGPGMAIALLTTFYGLMLAHLLYLPLARLVAAQGAERAETLNVAIEGMLKLARRRPIHEVRQLFDPGGAPAVREAS